MSTQSLNDPMVEIVYLLRQAADIKNPEWMSLCLLLVADADGLWHTAVLLSPQGADSWWTRPVSSAVLGLADEWLAAMQASGEQPWHAMAVACERVSGDFKAFFVPWGEEAAREWTLTADRAGELLEKAWQQLDIHPKYDTSMELRG